MLLIGASSGIGREISVLFAKNGASVALMARDTTALEETRKLCIAENLTADRTLILSADITCEKNSENAINSVLKEFGKLNILVSKI